MYIIPTQCNLYLLAQHSGTSRSHEGLQAAESWTCSIQKAKGENKSDRLSDRQSLRLISHQSNAENVCTEWWSADGEAVPVPVYTKFHLPPSSGTETLTCLKGHPKEHWVYNREIVSSGSIQAKGKTFPMGGLCTMRCAHSQGYKAQTTEARTIGTNFPFLLFCGGLSRGAVDGMNDTLPSSQLELPLSKSLLRYAGGKPSLWIDLSRMF